MIEWVWRAASNAGATDVVVATDDTRIAEAVTGFSGTACMTSAKHTNGTDRIVEVIEKNGWQDDRVIVNLQGDEPLMPAANIKQVADNLETSGCDISTLHKKISQSQAASPDLVKLVLNHAGQALYFSRSSIPFDRNQSAPQLFGHIGLYAYRAGFVRQYAGLPACELETAESLEQLRALYHGFRITSALAIEAVGPGVDTEADLAKVETMLNSAL